MNIITGYGYYVKDGKKVSKFNLPIGDHPDPIGYTFVEVANQQELDGITLDKSDEQIAAEAAATAQGLLKKSAISKLSALGLSTDEINAIIS